MMRVSARPFSFSIAVCLFACGVGCGSSSDSDPAPGPAPTLPEPGATDFESDLPGSQQAGPGNTAATGGTSSTAAPSPTGTAAPGAPEASDNAGSAARAIEEADIIKVEGGLLYALSQYGGLSVIDVSTRDELVMLGRHKVQATPFEMYVRDGIVLALYNGYGEYTYDAASQQWGYYQTSYVVALDARDPSSISVIGKFGVAGNISDSRVVGDVLYVVAYENGYCWQCADEPNTNLISLDISDVSAIKKVDQLSLPEREDTYSWKRSVMATDQRLYIAGPAYGNADRPVGSTIQVVDISDPSGDMVEGDSVELVGQINSRWQMDEFEGVLRVVSQPFAWRVDVPPAINTFRVNSSADIVPLGSALMNIPRQEQLQSVRFDGPRGYAITFEQIDPLFTLDLSDPEAPKQVGELVMPGFVYHMEPRGDRVLGLGFDQGNQEGSITVSLFDVSDMSKPTMIDRVNFGGDWGSLAEDQDRIHKAFNVLDDQGLILVPFSGYEQSQLPGSDGCYDSRYLSGVQLVDFANDQLDLRGVAPANGQARRGFIHDERLLTMSDERVESFDISDRSVPKNTARLPIAHFVTHSAGAGEKLVRIGQNWWSSDTELDVTPLAEAENPNSGGRLSLPMTKQHGCYGGSWLGDVHSNGDHVYLMYQSYDYRPDAGSKESTKIVTVDVSDMASPKVVADVDLGFTPAGYYYGGYGIINNGAASRNVGSTLAILNRSYQYDQQGRIANNTSSIDVVDLSDPAHPRRKNVALPVGFGGTGLLVSENVVATSHYAASSADARRARFYLDRLDLTDATRPVLLPPVNVPGSLLAYDAASENAITVDYRQRTIQNQTSTQCYEVGGGFESAPNTVPGLEPIGTCHVLEYTLFLVEIDGNSARVVDRHTLPLGKTVGSTALGDDRLFVSVGQGGYYYGGVGLADSSYYSPWFASGNVSVLVLGGLRTGTFESGVIELPRGDNWYGTLPLVASGERAVVSTGFRGKLSVIDAADVSAPSVVRTVDIDGYAYDIDVVGDVAAVSLGQDGVKTIAIND